MRWRKPQEQRLRVKKMARIWHWIERGCLFTILCGTQQENRKESFRDVTWRGLVGMWRLIPDWSSTLGQINFEDLCSAKETYFCTAKTSSNYKNLKFSWTWGSVPVPETRGARARHHDMLASHRRGNRMVEKKIEKPKQVFFGGKFSEKNSFFLRFNLLANERLKHW